MSEANQDSVLIRVEGLTKTYPDGQVQALDGVSFTIRRGEYVAIMGPSGCGKSTLLNMLSGLDVPDGGEIYFEDQPLSKMPDPDRFRSSKLGFVFQSFLLIPTLKAVENVQVPMMVGPLSASERAAKARQLLEEVGMGHRTKHLPAKLSVGERQRVAIARALANDPPLLYADEPTGSLDSKRSEEILTLFDRLHRERNLTLVVVTHSDTLAQRASRVIHMLDGRVEGDVTRA